MHQKCAGQSPIWSAQIPGALGRGWVMKWLPVGSLPIAIRGLVSDPEEHFLLQETSVPLQRCYAMWAKVHTEGLKENWDHLWGYIWRAARRQTAAECVNTVKKHNQQIMFKTGLLSGDVTDVACYSMTAEAASRRPVLICPIESHRYFSVSWTLLQRVGLSWRTRRRQHSF